MRLITKTILFYLIAIIPILAIAGFFGYKLIKEEMSDATNEYIEKEKLNAEKLIESLTNPRIIYLSTDSLCKAIPVSYKKEGEAWADSIIYDNYEGEDLNFRILKSYFESKGQNYYIIIAKTTMEDDDVVESLYKAFGLIMVLLVVAFFLLNWILSRVLWMPFYKTMNQLKHYDIKSHSSIKFEKVATREFKQLNSTLNAMMDKLYSDYIQQKEFTENASHEMQTPLAVIKANLNLLMQSPNLAENEMKQIEVIDNTVKKLSALNKALLLLSKIENNQYNDIGEVNLSERIQKALGNYQGRIEAFEIAINVHIFEHAVIKINSSLADVLINNILQNAVRHNHKNGHINIDVSEDQLVFSNTGAPLNIKPEELFFRFKKNDASKESLGLGLSIVKGICDLYNFELSYTYTNSLHVFSIKF